MEKRQTNTHHTLSRSVMMRSFLLLTLLSTFSCSDGLAFSPSIRRSTMTMKRGRGSFKNESGASGMGGASPKPAGISGGAAPSTGPKRNWITIPNAKLADLSTSEPNKVKLVDTMVPALVDRATNPTGAVAVMKYGATDKTYCFSASCPSCKIPLTKAKVLEPNDESGSSPRIACDFCKSTYKASTGDKLSAQEASGVFGSIAKAVLSSNDGGPLPTYQLAEQKGKLLISLDK